jgi:hypothetical protein
VPKKIKDVKPIPLFPKSENIAEISIRDYPELCDFLTSGPEWRYQTWSWGQEFLAFIGRNKSTNTYVRFRSEVEKFLLWSFIKRKQSIVTFKKFLSIWNSVINQMWTGSVLRVSKNLSSKPVHLKLIHCGHLSKCQVQCSHLETKKYSKDIGLLLGRLTPRLPQ